MKVAYFLSNFPALSETFIVREMMALKALGFSIKVFAIAISPEDRRSYSTNPEFQALCNEAVYLSRCRRTTSRGTLTWLHLRELVTNPVRYIKTFRLSRSSRKRVARSFNRSMCPIRAFRDEGFDHIHAHFASQGCTYAMFFSMLTATPFSFTVHAHDIFLTGVSDLLPEKIAQARFVVSISDFNKKYLLDKYDGMHADKIKIIHCGIDTTQFKHRSARESQHKKIIATARLVKQKGLGDLIRACKCLLDSRGPDFECEIIGDGSERPELEQLRQELCLQSIVHMPGAKEQEYVQSSLLTADIFVLPCVVDSSGAADGIPVALMEAMALGIPVISTNVSGIPELLSAGGGLLVEPGTPQGLAQAISKYLDATAAERAEIGRAGRAMIAAQFDLVKEASKLADLFSQSDTR